MSVPIGKARREKQEIPDIVQSLLGAGTPVAPDDLNGRKAYQQYLKVADEKVVDDALASCFSDYEDALQYYSALTRNVDVIITRNTRDFVHASIPVLTPDEFLTKR